MNILAIFPRYFWTRKQSPVRRHAIMATRRMEGVNLKVSGAGWPDWFDEDSGVSNIERIMPDAEVVWWYKPLGTRQAIGVNLPLEVSSRYLTVESYNECYWSDRRAEKESRQAGTRLVICHHENDLVQFDLIPSVHIPHCAEVSVFGEHCREWKDRDIDVLLTGIQSPSIYPLRATWLELFKEGRLNRFGNVVCHPRPPYRAKDLAACDALVDEYARLLGRAKVVLGCSSRYRYALARFPEAAMAGAVHVSDMPHQAPSHYGSFIWPPEPNASHDCLLDHVGNCLATLESLEGNETPHKLAKTFYCQEAYAAEFVRVCQERL